jgi:hypothetical protein
MTTQSGESFAASSDKNANEKASRRIPPIMPRNISFSMTTDQIRARTKTVTRRLGWKHLKAGEILNACVKCMGLKPGEKIERLGQIRVVSATREQLVELMRDDLYGKLEAEREGFPDLDGKQFVEMFCQHMRPIHGCVTEVTRIQFEYLDQPKSTDELIGNLRESSGNAWDQVPDVRAELAYMRGQDEADEYGRDPVAFGGDWE